MPQLPSSPLLEKSLGQGTLGYYDLQGKGAVTQKDR